ncbi:MAG: hypothetical protein AMJ53_11715 [Gammaproteobacteria bacterium SG8_11]|nr:MAG: hypothetical protein AMJ53_11715 [Gammaproteobacteria bacterium SG8_11]
MLRLMVMIMGLLNAVTIYAGVDFSAPAPSPLPLTKSVTSPLSLVSYKDEHYDMLVPKGWEMAYMEPEVLRIGTDLSDENAPDMIVARLLKKSDAITVVAQLENLVQQATGKPAQLTETQELENGGVLRLSSTQDPQGKRFHLVVAAVPDPPGQQLISFGMFAAPVQQFQSMQGTELLLKVVRSAKRVQEGQLSTISAQPDEQSAANVARPMDVPVYDIDAYCKYNGITSSTAEEIRMCIKWEQEAYDYLKSNWQNLSQAAKAECFAAPLPLETYTGLRACIHTTAERNQAISDTQFRY